MLTNPAVDASGSDQAGIHRLQPRDPFGSVTIHRQGVFAPGGDHRWMGSLAMDGAGAIALGYSVSSPTTFPSIRSTARPPGAC